MKAVIYAFKLRAPGMMQIISDIYERIFPAVTAGPNVLVQFDWSSSSSLEDDREGGRISKIWKQSPEKAAEIIDSFFELTTRTCQKFSSRQSPLYSAWSALKEVSYILLPHQYASCINLDWELVQRNRSHVAERYWLKGECGLVGRGNNMGPTQMKSMVHQ